MRVLLCTTTFKNISNGPTKFANLLHKNGNGTDGIEVHILTEDISADTDRCYQCKLGMLKKVLPLAPVYRMFKYYYNASRLSRLYQFDFIIYNNAIYGLIHGFFKSNVIGMINDDNNQKNISLAHLSFKYGYIKKVIFKWFEKGAIVYSKYILTNSDYLTNLLLRAYPAQASKIKRLYKGIDIDITAHKNYSDWDAKTLDRIQILFVKNDFIRGGIEILAKSLASIELPFSLTIIGTDSKYDTQIKSYFNSKNVSVQMLGLQSQESVFECMATHHIFCVPSLQEALGVANLEALNIGIPVVSSDAGGLPEVLGYGHCGFTTVAGDADSLASGIKLCIYNTQLRKEKVMNGFEHVKRFKREFIYPNLQKILNGGI